MFNLSAVIVSTFIQRYVSLRQSTFHSLTTSLNSHCTQFVNEYGNLVLIKAGMRNLTLNLTLSMEN